MFFIILLGLMVVLPIIARLILPINIEGNIIDKAIASIAYGIIKLFKLNVSSTDERYTLLKISKKKYIFRTIIFVYKVIFISAMIILFFILIDKNTLVDNKIKRPNYAANDRQQEIYYSYGDAKGKVSIDVKKQEYTLAQLEKKKQNISQEITKKLLINNKDALNVEKKLNLLSRLPKYGLNIIWEMDSKIIGYDGTVRRSIVEDVSTVIGYSAFYRSEKLMSEKLNLVIKKTNNINDNIEDYIKVDNSFVNLPDTILNKKISWSSKNYNLGIERIALIIALAICVYMIRIKKISTRYEERLLQSRLYYPEILNILVLYIQAGLSAINAWEKLANEWKKDDTYISEVIASSLNELNSGISVQKVFENLSNRCGGRQYSRLSQLMVQNIKSGSSTMAESLKQEMQESLRERLSLAKMLAIKAQAKLMLPTMLMLLVVFIIILSPSVISLGL